MRWGWWWGTLLLCSTVAANYPVFLPTHSMRELLVPGNTRVGSVIYRLRATDSDRDYPLTFAATDYGSYVIRVEALPCTTEGCSANVVLERSVAAGQRYTFRLTVRDSTGDTTTAPATVTVTPGQADQQAVFPHVPGVIMVPEDTKVGTELEYIIVRKNPRSNRPASLELWRENGNGSGSGLREAAPQFRLDQSSKQDTTTGLIRLGAALDYEHQTMFRLAVYALGGFTVEGEDSRNVAGFPVVVVVADVQDTPPLFHPPIPHLTLLPPNITQGDLVLRVTAHDGDTGSPRQITYGLVSENNPFTVFFTIGRDNGELRLARPLRDLLAISRADQPLLLKVVAEEVGAGPGEGGRAATEATVALMLPQPHNTPPYFQSTHYATMLAENSVQGTMLVFDESYDTQVRDDDMGKRGVFALSLLNDNGTFEVSPGVAQRSARFVLRVRDNSLLDYEARRQLTFTLVATEVSGQPGPALSSAVNVTVYLTDVNDQAPVFSRSHYTATMPENVTAGYHVLTVEAADNDTVGAVRYSGLAVSGSGGSGGPRNDSLALHPHSGAITVATSAHGFDRELAAEYHLLVEAEDGGGGRAEATVTLTVTDVNDNAPQFVRDPHDFVLNADGLAFAGEDRAFIKAVDGDAEPPNNVVRYEIVSGNYGDRFSLHAETGELRVVRAVRSRAVRQTTLSVTVLTVRAYDLGVPTQWAVGVVRIFPEAAGARVLTFVVPGRPSRAEAERLIAGAVGGRASVTVQQVAPLRHPLPPSTAHDLTAGSTNTDKSVVVATVVYPDQSAWPIDFDKLQQALDNRTRLATIANGVGGGGAGSTALFWLLLLALLLIAAALICLLACCLCPCCPLYAATTRKRSHVHSAETVQFVKEEEHNQESKATQAEWSGRAGRREAWSGGGVGGAGGRVVLLAAAPPRPNGLSVIYTHQLAARHPPHQPVLLEDLDAREYRVVDPARLARPEADDTDSLLRHERERGSVNEHYHTTRRQHMFIRDGGAEILRLVTCNAHDTTLHTDEPMLNQPETRPYTEVVEGVGAEGEGKDIIMRRFMDDQKTTTVADNRQAVEAEKKKEEDVEKVGEGAEEGGDGDAVRRLHLSTGEVRSMRELLLTRLLAQSLRVPEDTQSLPGGVTAATTQTDHDRGTQTDGPPRWRRAKSDAEDSDSERDTCRHARRCRASRSLSRCAIRTPILEEAEAACQTGFAATKSSVLREQVTRRRLRGAGGREARLCRSQQDVATGGGYVHEVVRDIERRSLESTPTGWGRRRVVRMREDSPEGDSEEDFTGSVYDRAKSSMSTRNACTSPIQTFSKTRQDSGSPGRTESPDKSTSKGTATSSESRKTPRQSRYMEWYKTKREERERKKSEEKEVERQKVMRPVKTATKPPTVEKSSIKKAAKKQAAVKENVVSAFRTANKKSEAPAANKLIEELKEEIRQRAGEEDRDSGIAMRALPIKHHTLMEKKSVFTIAYDDMMTRQLRIDSPASPPQHQHS